MTSMKKPAPLDFKTQFGLALDESDDAIIVDLFAGGGGASTGLEIGLGRQVALAINHNPAAISMHMANHPHAAHYQTDVWGVDPLESTGGKTVAWLHASPTLIQVGYGEREGQAARVPGLEKPLGTVVAGGIKHALVIPHLVKFRFDATGAPVDQPMPTITSGGECARPAGAAHALGVASAVLVGAGGPSYGGKPVPVDQPLGTVVTENHRAIASAFMVQANGGYNTTHCRAMEAPMSTITNKGSQQQLATAHLVTLRKGSHGGPVDAPLGTQTGNDHHGLVAAHLLHLRGNCDGRGADEPLHTISAGGQHHGVVSAEMVGASLTPEQLDGALWVSAFLMRYHSTGGQWAAMDDPLTTITTKDRLALVTVWISGSPYVIVDIRLRMLKPRELYRAQGFPDSYIIDRGHDGREFNLSEQVHMCGNSVSPGTMAAIARANDPWKLRRVRQVAA